MTTVDRDDREVRDAEVIDAIDHLQTIGLLDRAEAAENVRSFEMSGRAVNVLVVMPDGSGFFVKQGIGPRGRETVANEGIVLAALQESAPDLAPYLPELLHADSRRGRITLRLIPDAIDVPSLHLPGEPPLLGVAAEFGRALALLHRAPVPHEMPPAPVPAVFLLHRPRIADLAEYDAAGWRGIRRLQADASLQSALDDLAASWQHTCVVHHDIKWANLVLAGPDAGLLGGLRLVDWEFAAVSDPSWDVGCALAEYVWHACAAIPSDSSADPLTGLVAFAAPAIDALVTMYAAHCTPDVRITELLDRAARMTAARIVAKAIACFHPSEQARGLEIASVISAAPKLVLGGTACGRQMADTR